MKVAIITDTHFNFKKGNKVFHEYFEKFYKQVFFPTLKKYKIDTVIHMGDMFDNRKTTDYWSIDWTRRVILEPLKKYNVHVILGNHDIFYKNTTELNSPMLLLNDFKNIKVYDKPTTVQVGEHKILFVPWITPEGEQETLQAVQNTLAKVCMGHLELSGFYVNKGTCQQHGRDKSLFKKFERVFSGHYHTRNDDGKIFYLGNPYQLYWSDYSDKRGFTIFDTDTHEIIKIDNPFEMFKICKYNEDNLEEDLTSYEGCIVKLIIENKTDQHKYEKFLDKLIKVSPHELKIVEHIKLNSDFEADEVIKNEDTLTLLKRYVDESEIKLNKPRIKDLIQSIYQESFQLQ
jgi:DNA repair exonuclease SbcCD nuclease subunit